MNTIPIGTTFRSTSFFARDEPSQAGHEFRIFVIGYSTKCNDKLKVEYMYDVVIYELGERSGPCGEPIFFQNPRQMTDEYLEKFIERFEYEVVFEDALADEMKDYHKE